MMEVEQNYELVIERKGDKAKIIDSGYANNKEESQENSFYYGQDFIQFST